MLGRPLCRKRVHHRDGDPLNNAPANLLVLPSQRHHAHLEACLRRARSGQVPLFPDAASLVETNRRGPLFDHLLLAGEFADIYLDR